MIRFLFNGILLSADCALRLYKLGTFHQTTTAITLIASCSIIATSRTSALNKSISKKYLALLAVQLNNSLFCDILMLLKLEKDFLCYFSVFLRAGISKYVKINVKPLVNLLMNLLILLTYLFWSQFLFQGLDLSCRSVVISSTDIN